MGKLGGYTKFQELFDDPNCRAVLEAGAAHGDTFSRKAAGVLSAALPESIAKRWVKTGKSQTSVVEYPYGYVLLAVLVELADIGWPISELSDAGGESAVEANIPGNLLSGKGQLLVRMRPHDSGAHVDAAAVIPGQAYDWGRSKRILARLFNSINARAAEFAERNV